MSINKYTEQNGRLEGQNGVCGRTSDSKSAEHHTEKSHIKVSTFSPVVTICNK